ncbi:MAG: hypothetical protein A3A43_03210 [Candidatus Liptonbacteria bacterium RIFCSPLOWO2_01_FULL_56_20]|uniref:Uncharacterized protein n=1 Tax=Candidatus Liptonbacteria bacterium RIFCSPLOWO2_01_FULL_56_20 TaxID=1798652 RepID=A0A1G2CHD3_9BACT|nr:MAG: hypothetical protein UY96_C0005G0019 [Parcubacteria group bacterium GW2011_GWB1_56_8]OGY97794.1 MAG: hypothetical protein A2681_01195 [Candidatus Liptonbacteria bacterium RIFCSPHIGHO2_01_FULL_56_18b]OGZ00637.1 MAG: hypothetical protein A3A43_03210 [Candidatus Liptonbacteria bacterium RIFCSPLOWO2_01_FULL_56_20]
MPVKDRKVVPPFVAAVGRLRERIAAFKRLMRSPRGGEASEMLLERSREVESLLGALRKRILDPSGILQSPGLRAAFGQCVDAAASLKPDLAVFNEQSGTPDRFLACVYALRKLHSLVEEVEEAWRGQADDPEEDGTNNTGSPLADISRTS